MVSVCVSEKAGHITRETQTQRQQENQTVACKYAVMPGRSLERGSGLGVLAEKKLGPVS